MSEGISGQIAALRGEASQARRLAATLLDEQAAADLTLYAEALEAEAAQLLEAVGTPDGTEVRTPAHTSLLARFAAEHA